MNKMEKKPDNKILNPKFKAFLSLIGNILMNIVIGNSLIWLYLPETINFNMYLKPNQNIAEDNPFNKTRKLILFLILTFSNVTKLIFTTYTKYNSIRIYIIYSLLLIIISHSLLLYMFQIKLTSIVAFILYGIGIGFPYHQLVINTNLHFITKKFYIILINKICYHASPLLYLMFFQHYGKTFSPIGSEIIIFYLILLFICTPISFDYLRDCHNKKNGSYEQNLLIKNELEFSISDMTETTERSSGTSESSVKLEKKEKILLSENENINRAFLSKRKNIISVLKHKNIYLIILFYFSANFLTFEKIYMIKSDDISLFLLIVFISNLIIYTIFSKTQMPPLILRLLPLFAHILIIIYHKYNSRKENFINKIELFLVSLSYVFQHNIPLYLMKKIYGEKNAICFSSLLITLSNLSLWIFVYIDGVRNSFRILILVFMILLLLFINTDAFNFNEENNRQKLGIELEDKDDESKNEEKENEIEDVCGIADVKSDIGD